MSGRDRTFRIERRDHAVKAAGGMSSAKPAANRPEAAVLSEIKEAVDEMRREMRSLVHAGAGAPAAKEPAFDAQAFKQQVVEAERLKSELQELSDAIERTKQEIASLGKARSDETRTASEALRAVVQDTESATDGIITSAEEIEEIAGRLRAQVSGDEALGQVDELFEAATRIFENCNFQDITGQRITRVVNTMEFIDERIRKMMEIWGGDAAFADLKPEEKPMPEHGETLHGPAMDGDGSISQADIDALFD